MASNWEPHKYGRLKNLQIPNHQSWSAHLFYLFSLAHNGRPPGIISLVIPILNRIYVLTTKYVLVTGKGQIIGAEDNSVVAMRVRYSN